MKLNFTILLLIGINLTLYSKGCNGKYIVTGIMYNKKSGAVISNQKFIINNEIIETDINGKYNIIVNYKTSDKYSNSIKAFIENSKLNQNKITFSFNDKKKCIENKWRKYGLKYCFEGEIYTLTKNLYW